MTEPDPSDDPPRDGAPKQTEPLPSTADDGIVYGDQSIHQTFQQQITELLANADITEEQRQQILIAMNCPCCGGGGLSVSFKIKTDPGSTPSF